jgi:hypothetical protein
MDRRNSELELFVVAGVEHCDEDGARWRHADESASTVRAVPMCQSYMALYKRIGHTSLGVVFKAMASNAAVNKNSPSPLKIGKQRHY